MTNKDLQLHEDTWGMLTKQERRDKICQIEEEVRVLEVDQPAEIELAHIMCNGVYAREIVILKGTALVGEIHTQDHINIVSKGSIRVATEDGVHTITAPATFISKAGIKRAGYALEDTIWTVLHATDEVDDSKRKKLFTIPSYELLKLQTDKNADSSKE